MDFTPFTWSVIEAYLLSGLKFSVLLTLVATIGGIVFGTILALMRLSSIKWLNLVATFYVDMMRSIPLLMVLLWFFLLVPLLIGRPIGAEFSAVITFIAFEAAFFCEIVRSGIKAIPHGQFNAAYALGMTYAQNFRLIILPQALRNMLPVILTQTIILFQDTSLVYIITAHDLLHGFIIAGANLSAPREALILAAITYLVICWSFSAIVKKLQTKIAIIR